MGAADRTGTARTARVQPVASAPLCDPYGSDRRWEIKAAVEGRATNDEQVFEDEGDDNSTPITAPMDTEGMRIQIQLYCTFAFPVQFSLLSWQGFGQQGQIRSAASNLVEF